MGRQSWRPVGLENVGHTSPDGGVNGRFAGFADWAGGKPERAGDIGLTPLVQRAKNTANEGFFGRFWGIWALTYGVAQGLRANLFGSGSFIYAAVVGAGGRKLPWGVAAATSLFDGWAWRPGEGIIEWRIGRRNSCGC